MVQKHFLLILGFDLSEDGSALGERHQLRLRNGVNYAVAKGYEICVGGSFSPKHPGQKESMARMSAKWIRHHFPGVAVHELVDTPSFNTRGELQAFMCFLHKQGQVEASITTADWHIGRAKAIFVKEFGEKAAGSVHFVGIKEPQSFKLRILEPLKRVHMHLHPSWRRRIEQVVRRMGVNPSGEKGARTTCRSGPLQF